MASLVNSNKGRTNTIIYKHFQKKKLKRKEYFSTNFMITLKPKPSKDSTRQEATDWYSLWTETQKSSRNINKPNPATYKNDYIPQPSGIYPKKTMY